MTFLDKNKINGRKAEDLAVNYLKEKGYQILERNFWKKWGEIDIVCFDKKTKEIVFVEVKASEKNSSINPEERLTFYKKERIKKAILSYLSKIKKPEIKWRFDFIAIKIDASNFKRNVITHYSNQEIEYS
ncbi:MAG: YraN family protein [Minisyncoccia bacterium]